MNKSITILDYQARMIEELRTLQDRIVKLHAYLISNQAHMDNVSAALMLEQLSAMQKYEAVLNTRIRNMIKECWNND